MNLYWLKALGHRQADRGYDISVAISYLCELSYLITDN